MKQRTKITDGPVVTANVSPQTKERLEALAAEQAVSVAHLVRVAIDKAYRHKDVLTLR
jgi:hypothetical protein